MRQREVTNEQPKTGSTDIVNVYLSDLPGYEEWWKRHPDELDIVRESMDLERIEIRRSQLNSDHTGLFEELLEDTQEEHGV